MKKKLIGFFLLFLMCGSTLPISPIRGNTDENINFPSESSTGKIEVLSNDLLRYIDPFDRHAVGPGPGYYDTSEYLIGSVGVGVIFLESNGAIDPGTENWNTTETTNVQTQINQAMTWWMNQNQWASLSYVLDVHTAVPTSYEPIIHPSAMTDPTYEKLWAPAKRRPIRSSSTGKSNI